MLTLQEAKTIKMFIFINPTENQTEKLLPAFIENWENTTIYLSDFPVMPTG